ncbi:hypothetical protein STEG23_033193, partial [Scotinomys teguina]
LQLYLIQLGFSGPRQLLRSTYDDDGGAAFPDADANLTDTFRCIIGYLFHLFPNFY